MMNGTSKYDKHGNNLLDRNGPNSMSKPCLCGCGKRIPIENTQDFLPNHLSEMLRSWHARFKAPHCTICGRFPGANNTIILCERCFTKRQQVLEAKEKWHPSLEISDPTESLETTEPATGDVPVPEPFVPKPEPDEDDEDPDEWIPDPDSDSKEDDNADAEKAV